MLFMVIVLLRTINVYYAELLHGLINREAVFSLAVYEKYKDQINYRIMRFEFVLMYQTQSKIYLFIHVLYL